LFSFVVVLIRQIFYIYETLALRHLHK